MRREGETCLLGRVWDLVKTRGSLCLIHVKVISENEGDLGNGAETWKGSNACGQVSLTFWERSVQVLFIPLLSFSAQQRLILFVLLIKRFAVQGDMLR